MGAVRIRPASTLAETAARIGEALGVEFSVDPPGRYDEFPSFSAECAGLSFALLGIPLPDEQVTLEPITDYTLQIGLDFQTDEANERCDASGYFGDLLRARTDLIVVEI